MWCGFFFLRGEHVCKFFSDRKNVCGFFLFDMEIWCRFFFFLTGEDVSVFF